MWQITITNKKTGPHTDKAAFFIEGGRHAGEITGIEATLYFVNHVLTNYGKDAAITKLLDTKAIYAKPHNNPDGASLYHYTAQTLRSTVRPDDNDGDGLFDEDAGEDLDGDGFVRQMRKFVGAGKGTAIVDKSDPQGRLMQNVGPGKGDYDLYSEGFDNDADGRVNEDGIGGLDLHRNYPENWRPMTEATNRGYTQQGAGAYPLSEPETKAVFDFLMRHPNVGIAQSLDTSVPMILRGPSTSKSEESMFPEDLEIIKKFDQKGLEITGYPWAGDTFFTYATAAAAAPRRRRPPRASRSSGMVPSSAISTTARFGTATRSGTVGGCVKPTRTRTARPPTPSCSSGSTPIGPGRTISNPGRRPHTRRSARSKSAGGTRSSGRRIRRRKCSRRGRRTKRCSTSTSRSSSRRSSIVSATAKPAADGAQEITVTVTNEGGIPTALEIAKRVKIVRPDTAVIQLAQGQTFVGGPAGGRAGGGGAGFGRGGGGRGGPGGPATAPTTGPRQSSELGWLKPGEQKTVSWTVRGAGNVTVGIESTRGGVDRRTVSLK